MSNTPPIPEEMTPPWPAQPGPIDLPHADETVADVTVKARNKAARAVKVVEDAAAKRNVRKIAGVGAAIGIGSAAIVAALLYTNRNTRKK